MFEFKDLAGLSGPLKRLIEVVAEGVGGISRPLLTRKNADARAYEIRTIAGAIADSQKLLPPAVSEDGDALISASASSEQHQLTEAALDQRITARVAYQEEKRQENIEQIIQHAADDIRRETHVDAERPNSDWTSRFFRIAEDITTDEMQVLWGKVLAGEVKRPGSYSLRALDLLKNITQREAEVFVRVGQITVTCDGRAFLPDPDNGEYLQKHFGLRFTDFLLLREIDLLVATNLDFILQPADQDQQSVFTCGNTLILVNRPTGTPKQTVRSIVFTEIGRQLLQLVEKKTPDPNYIMKIASFFRREGVYIQAGLITGWQGDEITYARLDDVGPESDQ